MDIGAPGVRVFSTVPGNKYEDLVLDSFGLQVGWDGTSMVTPHVAGATALYWSRHPQKNWRQVKEALLESAVEIPALRGKSVSGGKLDLIKLMAVR